MTIVNGGEILEYRSFSRGTWLGVKVHKKTTLLSLSFRSSSELNTISYDKII